MLNPLLFLIRILPVVDVSPSVIIKFSATLLFPDASTNAFAEVAVPLYKKFVLARLNPTFISCLFGFAVSFSSLGYPEIKFTLPAPPAIPSNLN